MKQAHTPPTPTPRPNPLPGNGNWRFTTFTTATAVMGGHKGELVRIDQIGAIYRQGTRPRSGAMLYRFVERINRFYYVPVN